MKTIRFIPLLVVVLAPAAGAESARILEMRDASTHEQLALTYQKASQADPMHKMQPAKGPDPSLVNQPEDLVASSDIMSFGGRATLVPKHAILHVPKNLEDRIKFVPGSKIVNWADFFALNRGWITTVEVSRGQAEGNDALADEISERVQKSTNLVVATYQGGAISVLPLKKPQETANGK